MYLNLNILLYKSIRLIILNLHTQWKYLINNRVAGIMGMHLVEVTNY